MKPLFHLSSGGRMRALAGCAALIFGTVWVVSAQSDTTAPTAAIATPGSNEVVTSLGAISGTATDTGTGGGAASGVAAVTVGLSRRIGNSFEYWNGTT